MITNSFKFTDYFVSSFVFVVSVPKCERQDESNTSVKFPELYEKYKTFGYCTLKHPSKNIDAICEEIKSTFFTNNEILRL